MRTRLPRESCQVLLFANAGMRSENKEIPPLERKNRRVVAALLCGILLPFLYVAFAARYLPDWVDRVVVGLVVFVCFFHVIPENTVGSVGQPRRKLSKTKPKEHGGAAAADPTAKSSGR